MSLLRALFLIIALVVQAWPGAAVVRGDTQPVCGMKCCAPGAVTCCCAEPAQAPALPVPASTPPVTGRELVPAVLWVAFTQFLPLAPPAEAFKARFHACRADTQPHVRLPVLFCSLLN
ncbi:MAG: hypothetical protein ACKVY0_11900 [Prosthecobacter sp.]|uniref:hypothetical protein n=1 Tax=Prosthecobacter sp. TaxID=1965333 RepID=UPI0038FDCF04